MKAIRKFVAVVPPWCFSIFIVAVIGYLTLVPKPLPDTDIQLFEGADKVVHAIMFGGLAWALCLDYARRHSLQSLSAGVLCLFASLSINFGALIEFLQDYMQLGRGCDFWDFVADAVGVVLFTLTARPVIVPFLANGSDTAK